MNVLKKLMFFVFVLMSATGLANRTLVVKNKVQLDLKTYSVPGNSKAKEAVAGIFLTPVEIKKDALGSEYKVDAGVRLSVDSAKDWKHDIPNEKIDIKIDLNLKKIKKYVSVSVSYDETKTFNYTIPAGKDGDTVCLEVSETGVKECVAQASKK